MGHETSFRSVLKKAEDTLKIDQEQLYKLFKLSLHKNT